MSKLDFLELKVPPVIVFFAIVGLMKLAAMAAPWAAVALPEKKTIALAVAALGGLLAAPSIASFLRAGTTIHPEKPQRATKLVVTGIYRFTRNPMYLSLLIVLAGWAAYLANVAALLPLPLFIAYLNRFQIMPEERTLASLFGSEYEAYTRRVRRWL